VEAVLQLILLAVFSVCIIALAAGMTWIVVRVSPTPDPSKSRDPDGP
jgi:hypothetical protein